MINSFVVGPKACGKTLNGRLIADFLGCDAFGDIGTPFQAGYNATHVLVLTTELPSILCEGDSVYQFSQLRDLILRDPIFHARWHDPEPVPDAELSRLEEERLKNLRADDVPEASNFSNGDLVHLISGGKLMVVSDVKGTVIQCTWMDADGRIQDDSFPSNWLEKHATVAHFDASQVGDLGVLTTCVDRLRSDVATSLGVAL
ncbi:DUF2158 domain-containing protein [Roseibium sp.]|uniref:DUF2158 domain-containing protein n=1 Tax=Roseibium sp. TaxID=1936156 RepID=UPI003B52F1B6